MTGFVESSFGAVASLVDEGGPFVLFIFLCGLIMWAIVIERYWYFSRVLPVRPRPRSIPGRLASNTEPGARGRSGWPWFPV